MLGFGGSDEARTTHPPRLVRAFPHRDVQDELGSAGIVEAFASTVRALLADDAAPHADLGAALAEALQGLAHTCTLHTSNTWRLSKAGGWALIKEGVLHG